MRYCLATLIFSIAAQTISAQSCEALFSFGETGLTIEFFDQSTVEDGDIIVSWDWDFDDGSFSSEQNPVHTFPEPDRYDVVLVITTANGCTSEIEVRVETCILNVQYEVGQCDGDGIIPVDITINDVYDNADEVDVILDGQGVPGSPFEIDVDNPVILQVDVAGDGLSHELSIQSLDISTCGTMISLDVEDCSSDCFLSSLNVRYNSSVNHVIDVGDDFFDPVTTTIQVGDLVTFDWIGDGHSTTSDATSGPDSWNSGVIGIGSTFELSIRNPGVHPYYCIPHGAPGGSGMSGTIVANCPSSNELEVLISFQTTQEDPAGYRIYDNGVEIPGSPFSYNGTGAQEVLYTMPGDGIDHMIDVEDVADPSCLISRIFTAPDCGAAPSCSISFGLQQLGSCDQNNMIEYELDLQVINGSTSFDVFIDGTFYDNFPYNSDGSAVVSILIPGDGSAHSIECVDVADADCSATEVVTTIDCSIPCSIDNLMASLPSGGATHVVEVRDFDFLPEDITISSGDVIEWQWTGDVDHTSTSDATSGPDSWDSGLLGNGAMYTSPELSEGLHLYYCEPHGSPGGIGMAGSVTVQANCTNNQVTVELSFDNVNTGLSGYYVDIDGAETGPYEYDASGTNMLTILVDGDGQSHEIVVRDVEDGSCQASVSIETPDCNLGTECSLSLSLTSLGGCDSEEMQSVELLLEAMNWGSSYDLLVDGVSQGMFSYDGSETIIELSLAGDGMTHTIEVIDSDDATCVASLDIDLADCSIPCSIDNLMANLPSGGATHVVEVRDFDFLPEDITISSGDVIEWQWTGDVDHTSTSDATSGSDSWDSGLLGNGAVYTSPELSEGLHLYYCEPHGSPGGIGMAGSVTVQANCTNNQVTVELSFDNVNTGLSGYYVDIDGAETGPYEYDASGTNMLTILVDGDGQSHEIVIRDVEDGSCQASVSIETPDCNLGTECSLSLSLTSLGGCDSEEMQSVELLLEAMNWGASYDLLVDGVSQGMFSYDGSETIIELSLAGDGMTHTIEVIDSDDATCVASLDIDLADCSIACQIEISEASFGINTKHVVEVRDFDFFPQILDINLGDTVQFVWTGQIPHTVTSDLASGPASFDSGLLDEGAVWENVFNSAGEQAYYCIPHGAPGGVGMSGIIYVASSNPDSIVTTITYDKLMTSGTGLEFFIDGDPWSGNPVADNGQLEQSTSLLLVRDGQEHVITLRDLDLTDCRDSIVIEVPAPDTTVLQCELLTYSINFGECSESSVALELSLETNSPGASFNIFKDDIQLNDSLLFTDESGSFEGEYLISGNGESSQIFVSFLTEDSCSFSEEVLLPDCGVICLITNLQNKNGDTAIVLVRDFNFSPEEIEIVLGTSVLFDFIGEIPHTTTSDAISGPDTWNSGLLGQGEQYLVDSLGVGVHDYYCEPHGGPGRIGMAGSIQVLDTCAGNKSLHLIAFNVSAGSEFGLNVFLDGIKISPEPYAYDDPRGENEILLELIGDGQEHVLTLQDVETSFCAASIRLQTSLCGESCIIDSIELQMGGDVVNEVLVRDFDFYPEDLTIRQGQRLLFDFVGTIPHTTTSDALTGPDVWDSGLVGQGAQYFVDLSEVGDHPYYCIPHGGPGGIGMSGNINVLPPCEQDLAELHYQFQATGGSVEGYRLFVDGQLIDSVARSYQNRNGLNSGKLLVPADAQAHILTIQDMRTAFCARSQEFETGICSDSCSLDLVSVDFMGRSRDTVYVEDFEFTPDKIRVESGSVIDFIWTGEVPHTVSSDYVDTTWSFESGLQEQGHVFSLHLNTLDSVTYYCIPHGSPGGIGMAGEIIYQDICHDDSLWMTVHFLMSGLVGEYQIFMDGELVSTSEFIQGSEQGFQLEVPADSSIHEIRVAAAGDSSCNFSTTVLFPDCQDGCLFVTADFLYDQDIQSQTVAFESIVSREGLSYAWDFGDGQVSEEMNPVHHYESLGIYDVCLEVSDRADCMSRYCDVIRLVSTECRAGFDLESDGLTVDLFNTSSAPDDIESIMWTFSDGASAEGGNSLSHIFQTTGVYEVCIEITTESCTDTYCEILDLSDPCLLVQSEWKYESLGENSISFEDLSLGSPTRWLWGFGDGSTSTLQNPAHEYSAPGVYKVCLLIQTEGCNSNLCMDVEVGSVSSFNLLPKTGISIYPNPASKGTSVWIDFLDESPGAEMFIEKLSLVDMQGRLSSPSFSIHDDRVEMSLDSTTPGVYYVLAYGDDKIYSEILVVH